MRPLLLLTVSALMVALELPGIPAPGPMSGGRDQVVWGNDAFGPAGGSRSDDFRTNQIGLALGWGSWVFGVDHSILTTANPSEAPVYWGMPDPFFKANEGAERVDEGVITLGWRQEVAGGGWSAWGQGGGGVLATGDLGGREIQNGVHTVISQAAFRMPYERRSLQIVPLGYAGLGGVWLPWGPCGVRGGGLAEMHAEGWRRWQVEGLGVVETGGGGVWGGWRMDGAGGEAATRTAAVVATEETGPSVVAGFGVRRGTWGASIETARNLDNDAQYGRLVLTWDGPRDEVGSRNGRIWWGRIGLLPEESRVKGRGIDHAVATTWGPLLVLLGYRDNELSNHWIYDMAGRRNSVWAGVGQAPELFRTGIVQWHGWWETGLGYRHTSVKTAGFLTLDGEHAYTCDAAIARAAVGGGPRIPLGPDVDLGILALFEGLWSSRTESLNVETRNVVFPEIVVDRQEYPVEGPAWGAILALTGRWVF